MQAERFTASWCQPCKAFAPTWDRLVEEYDLDAIVWDVDTEPGMERAAEYGVKGIPAVFLEGQQVSYTDLEAVLQKVN